METIFYAIWIVLFLVVVAELVTSNDSAVRTLFLGSVVIITCFGLLIIFASKNKANKPVNSVEEKMTLKINKKNQIVKPIVVTIKHNKKQSNQKAKRIIIEF